MNGYIIFWTIVIFFSLISFSLMSFRMLVKGIPELREMFKQLGGKDSDSVNGQSENRV